METWKVKVHPKRAQMYLWGGDAVLEGLDQPVILCFRVDEMGESITFGRRDTSGNPIKTLGTLLPGETMSVSLQGMRGVWAKCTDPKLDTLVYCWLQRLS